MHLGDRGVWSSSFTKIDVTLSLLCFLEKSLHPCHGPDPSRIRIQDVMSFIIRCIVLSVKYIND